MAHTFNSVKKVAFALLVGGIGCRVPMSVPEPGIVRDRLSAATQVVIVTTPDWSSTQGVMRRFERASTTSSWNSLGASVPIVMGRTGLAWGVGFDTMDALGAAPHKREGDGKSPAGIFPLDTVFGFAADEMRARLRMPYVALTAAHECVDDERSQHYNTVVARVDGAVDWSSAEHMRAIPQYEIGVIVGYNADAPTRGRGSCIFLHIWSGPTSTTAGCTALDKDQLMEVIEWVDARKRPAIVQLTDAEYVRLRQRWNLP